MHQTAKRIRSIVNEWFKPHNAESFKAYKEMKKQEIWDKIKPANFETPEKAFRLCHLLYANKIAVQDLEEQKRIADDLDSKQ